MMIEFPKRKLLNGKVHKGYWIEVDGENIGYVEGESGYTGRIDNGSWNAFTLDHLEVRSYNWTGKWSTRKKAAYALMNALERGSA